MKLRAIAIVAAGIFTMAAQGSSMGLDGENFVKAVKNGDNDKALELLGARKATVINAKDANGDTALIVAVAGRDDSWTPYLLQNGADPNAANRTGDTALIAAARIGYTEAASWLLSRGAKVDQDNRSGETPLIVAVQHRFTPMVKLLLSKGADPDKTDNAAGYSARDYAKRDTRNPELLRLIDASKSKTATAEAATAK